MWRRRQEIPARGEARVAVRGVDPVRELRYDGVQELAAVGRFRARAPVGHVTHAAEFHRSSSWDARAHVGDAF